MSGLPDERAGGMFAGLMGQSSAGGVRKRSLAAVLSAAFGVGITLGMATPLVSLVLEARGHGSIVIGLMAAIYSATALVVSPLVPRLSRRLGPVRVMVCGMLLSAICLVLFPLFALLPVLFVVRALMGVGSSANWIVSETWVGRLVEERTRGRVVGLYATVWGGGLALGPAILAFVGTRGAVPFLVAAGILVLAALPVLAARRIVPEEDSRGGRWALLEAVRTAPVVMGAAFVCGVGETSFVALYPVYGLASGWEESMVVLQISVGAVGSLALQQPFGWLADRLDRGMLLVAVGLVASACSLVLPVLVGGPMIWPLIFLFGGAIAGFYTIGLVLLGERFAGGNLADANTGFIMSYSLGMILGPAVAGAVMRIVPGYGFVLVLGAFFAGYTVAAIAGLLAQRTRTPHGG